MFKTLPFRVTVIAFGIILSILSVSISANVQTTEVRTTTSVQDTSTIDSTVYISDSIRDELVLRTNEYITGNFPKAKLTAEALVTACEKHDFDICFALAQAEIESCMGTVGKAAKTNSPWNVGAADGRSAQEMNRLGYGYSHPDHSIEPYIELVKTKYLGDKRTINDLMKRYVTLKGARYATDPDYESSLRATYNRICLKTSIRELQEKLQQLG